MEDKRLFFRWAYALAAITVFYNLIEGLVSVYFGAEGGSVVLFGFGLDSFVEVLSGIGIWHMTWRMKNESYEKKDLFEKNALRVTGAAFYILAAGMIVTALINLYKGHKPDTTLWGIIVGLISILVMWTLVHFKVKAGRRFGSDAMLADAACSRACLYLSAVLLTASIAYELTGTGFIDSLGAIGIAVFSFREGREAFGKAEGRPCCCGGAKCA